MRLPRISLSLAIGAALVQAAPMAAERLVYDRALVDAGEWWRLLTAHLVHLSWTHLALDAAALLVAGMVLEARRARAFALLCLVAAAAAGLAVHLICPELARYAGLSAIAYAGVTAAALEGARHDPARRLAWLAVLASLGVKLALELLSGRPVLWEADPSIRVATVSHAAGVVAAAVLFAWRPRQASGSRSSASAPRRARSARWDPRLSRIALSSR